MLLYVSTRVIQVLLLYCSRVALLQSMAPKKDPKSKKPQQQPPPTPQPPEVYPAPQFYQNLLTVQEKQQLSNFINRQESDQEKIKAILAHQKLGKKIQELRKAKAVAELWLVKDFNKAETLADKAFEFYKGEKYMESLDKYSQAIVSAPFPEGVDSESTKLWIQMFAERAQAFFKLQRYENCIFDVEEVFKFNLEREHRNQLTKLYNACVAELKTPRYQEVSVKEANPYLAGASSYVQISSATEKGRTLRAVKNIPTGSIVVAQDAFASYLYSRYHDFYCNHCMRPLNLRPFPCQGCTVITYCSSKCSLLAWNLYHSMECRQVQIYKHHFTGIATLRLMMRLAVEAATVRPPTSELFGDEPNSIKSLVGENCIPKIELDTVINAIIATTLAQKISMFGKDTNFVDFATLVLRYLRKIVLNGFRVYCYEMKHNGHYNVYYRKEVPLTDIGIAVYSTASLINHSCNFNCSRTYEGNRIVIITNKDIVSQEEILISYGFNYKSFSYRDRQNCMKDRFGFECKCSACLNQLDNAFYMLKCPKCSAPVVFNETEPDNSICNQCFLRGPKLKQLFIKIRDGNSSLIEGTLQLSKKDLAKAEKSLLQSQKVFQQHYCSPVALKDVKWLIARCYMQQKKADLAIQYYTEALALERIFTGRNTVRYFHCLLELISVFEDKKRASPSASSQASDTEKYYEEAQALLPAIESRQLILLK